MSKAELLRRLNDVHRGTLLLVQTFSKEDFDRKAPAAAWTALDLFAHLSSWNRDAGEALAQGRPVPECRISPPSADTPRALPKVMDEFRKSFDSLLSVSRRTPANPATHAVLDQSIRHYQIHQNDLNALIASFRPH